jgi:hypothetical protein
MLRSIFLSSVLVLCWCWGTSSATPDADNKYTELVPARAHESRRKFGWRRSAGRSYDLKDNGQLYWLTPGG